MQIEVRIMICRVFSGFVDLVDLKYETEVDQSNKWTFKMPFVILVLCNGELLD